MTTVFERIADRLKSFFSQDNIAEIVKDVQAFGAEVEHLVEIIGEDAAAVESGVAMLQAALAKLQAKFLTTNAADVVAANAAPAAAEEAAPVEAAPAAEAAPTTTA